MKRRSRAGREPIKGQRRKTPEPKSRNAPKVQASSKLFPATEETEVARLIRELSEERKQRTATLEVLHLLSGSHGDLNRLFETILSNATKLCQANFGQLFLCEADAFRIVAQHNAPPAYAEFRQRQPLVRGRPLLRAAETKELVHIVDLREYVASNPADEDAAVFAKLSGVRTLLVVPMLKDGVVVGEIVIYRQEVRAFNDREIALLKSFAAQAVIAIENARLLNELRQRTTDLTEALEQQTATSDVLQIISSTPGDLRPVFETMLTNATRICEAKFGVLWLSEGERFRCVALHNAPPTFADHYREEPMVNPPPGSGLRRLFETRQVAEVTDMTTIRPYIERDPFVVASVELGGYRSVLNVPMLKEGALVGAISIFRQEVRPFTDKQVSLVTNFAAQAVIAIENARLLNELRQRTADLTEALEQQTATSEVLQVISSSPGDLEPVFASMLEKAIRVCEATFGNIYRWDGEAFHLLATKNTPQALAEYRRSASPVVLPAPNTLFGRLAAARKLIHIPDLVADQLYSEKKTPAVVAAVELGGVRTILVVPMLKEQIPA